MKIRNGFVSNSSSSSFCIYGTNMEFDNVFESIKNTLSEEEIGYIEEDDYYLKEIIEGLVGDFDVYYSDGDFFIGRSWPTIRDEETGGQFKDSVEDKLNKLFNKELNYSTYQEEIYD